jgi:hypothetical protein
MIASPAMPHLWQRVRGVANCQGRVDILPLAAANCPTVFGEVCHRNRRLVRGFGLIAIPTTPFFHMEREGRKGGKLGQFGGVW